MAEQPNRSWARYVTDAGINMSVMTETDWITDPNSGFTAFNTADMPFGPQSKTHHIRKCIYRDSTTFRSLVRPFGTTAAFGAAPATQSVFVQGNVAAVVYNLAQRKPERLRIPATSRNLLDHA